MSPNKNSENKGPKKTGILLSAVFWAILLVVLMNLLVSRMQSGSVKEITYTEFIQMVEEGKVDAVVMNTNKYMIYPKSEEKTDASDLANVLVQKAQEGDSVTYVTALLPNVEATSLIAFLEEHDVTVSAEMREENSLFLNLLLSYVVPMLLIVGLLVFLMRRMSGGMGGMGGVGKANAKVYMEKSTGVTFADVAGQDEAKESLQEIIDFLHNPGRYTEIGAKLPKGALLVGSPGTGKTLMAKAVAGEANVPFFSISGSDFVEMFVGVGASRVRDLFKEAAKVAPCIIFIDEIDTIGKTRDAGRYGGGNDEREQTLNQLLAELDGFDPTKGVIVLGATNRPEVLDKALLRPGRFDRRITVDRPNLAGRLATLQVHTRRIRLAEDVDLNKIAQATAGCVGADLANLVNEAALRAVRLGRKAVNQRDLLTSFEVVIAGTEKKGTVLTEREKKLIAYHEVGHALVAAKQKGAEPVTKITIVPHTQGALGFTMQTPEEERFLMDKEEIFGKIRVLLAGRSAEEVVFQTQTTGAANDIERATDLARKMVSMYGMSEQFGMMGLATLQSQYLDNTMGLNCAQETAGRIDQEVKTIVETCHKAAVEILEQNREKLDEVATYLLKKETITGAELMAILEGRDPEEVADPEPAPVPHADRNSLPNVNLEKEAMSSSDETAVGSVPAEGEAIPLTSAEAVKEEAPQVAPPSQEVEQPQETQDPEH